MIDKIKNLIAYIAYEAYQKGLLKSHIHVHSIDETISALIDMNNSLVRFGEGEIIMIEGLATATQESNKELGNRLREILESTKGQKLNSEYSDIKGNSSGSSIVEKPNGELLISIYDVFDGLNLIRPQNRNFWRRHLLQSRRTYERYLNHDITYENTFLTRCYYSFANKDSSAEWFDGIKKIWQGKDIILVEGECSHNGVGNDLLDGANSVKRIICPGLNAYRVYDQILKTCVETVNNITEGISEEESLNDNIDTIFLLSLGATAKPLAFDLYHQGYRVIDIGNLDMEYGWFLMGIEEKYDFPKYDIIGYEANYEAGYHQYLDEIVTTISY